MFKIFRLLHDQQRTHRLFLLHERVRRLITSDQHRLRIRPGSHPCFPGRALAIDNSTRCAAPEFCAVEISATCSSRLAA